MRLQRRQGGKIYLAEAYSQDSRLLQELSERWPASYITWESTGIPVPREGGGVLNSGPAYVLWRPQGAAPIIAAPPAAEEPAEEPAAPTSPELTGPAPAEASPPAATPGAAPARGRAGRPPGAPKTTRYKNITRVEHKRKEAYGYLVRLMWRGEQRQKFFSDRTYGDRLAALAAAIEWRDQAERELGKPRSERPIVGAAVSNTGIVGVTRTTRAGDPVFQVTWYEGGRQRRRTFNIRIMGERKALQAAKRARLQAERERLERA